MDKKDKERLKYKSQFLNLSYKIMQLRMNGQDPPDDLIYTAHEIGRLADIPEEELCNL